MKKFVVDVSMSSSLTVTGSVFASALSSSGFVYGKQLQVAGLVNAAGSGTVVSAYVAQTINQPPGGTASNIDLMIDRTETNPGSGPQFLIQAKVNGVDRLHLTNTGQLSIGGATVITGSSDTVQLVVKANSTQTVDFGAVFQVRNSSNSPVFQVSAGGIVTLGTISFNGFPASIAVDDSNGNLLISADAAQVVVQGDNGLYVENELTANGGIGLGPAGYITGIEQLRDIEDVLIFNWDSGDRNFYGRGANLTDLNASFIATGTVPAARLGSGTASSSTFLRGDNTWAPITATVAAPLNLVGTTNVVQLSAQASSTQTANVFEVRASGGGPNLWVDKFGSLSMNGNLTVDFIQGSTLPYSLGNDGNGTPLLQSPNGLVFCGGPAGIVVGNPNESEYGSIGVYDPAGDRYYYVQGGDNTMYFSNAADYVFDGSLQAEVASFNCGPLSGSRPNNFQQTWSNAGATFVAAKVNVTSTASATGSLLQDWQVSSVSKASIRKDGLVSSAAGFTSGGITMAPWSGQAAWIDMPTSGACGIGTGGAGSNAWIAYAATSDQWFIGASAGDVCYRNATGQKLHFGILNGGFTPTMSLKDGAIGINTTTPHKALEIYANTTNVSLIRLNNDGGNQSDNGCNLEFTQGGTLTGRVKNAYDTTNLWTLWLGGGSAPDLVALTSAGRVGIGTPVPATRLHVADASSPVLMTLGVNSTSGGYTALLAGVSAVSGGYAYIQGVTSSGSAYGNLILNEQAVGNVGIGTNNPATKLDVSGQTTLGTSAAGSRVDGRGPYPNAGMWLQYVDGNAYYDAAVDMRIRTNAGSGFFTDAMTLKADGKVGVGTTGPSARFQTNISTSGTAEICGYFFGSTQSGTFTDPGSRTQDKATLIVGTAFGNSSTTAAAVLNVYNYDGSILYVRGDGKVGIGTTAPANKLDVVGTASAYRHTGKVLTASTSGTAVSTDFSAGSIMDITASASFTLNNGTNAVNGDKFEYRIYNSGGSNITISFGSNFRFSNSIKSTDIQPIAAGKMAIIGVQYCTLGGVTKFDVIGYSEGYA